VTSTPVVAPAPAAARRRGPAVTDVASVVLLAIALATLWWSPTHVFRCVAEAGGLARCEVSTRLLGLVPLGHRTVSGIAHAGYGTDVVTSEVRDTTDRRRLITTRVEGLLLSDAAGKDLWWSAESHLLGASLGDVASAIASLLAGESATPFVAWYVPWPPLLLATLFLLIATSHLGTIASLALRRRGWLGGVSYGLAYWLPTLLVTGVLALAWLVALAGAHPPRWLAGIS
jgi:hypothetical protein